MGVVIGNEICFQVEMKFDDARKEMIKYLSSDEFKEREDAETTIPAIQILKEINKAGLLTTNSQTGEDEKGFNKETKRYYHIVERAYIDGFMKRERALKVIEYLNAYTDKIAYFIYVNPDPAFQKLFYEGDVKAVPSIPVTVSGSSSKSNKDIKQLFSATTMPTTLPQSTADFYKKNAKLNKSEDVLWLTFIDPEYGRNALKKDGLFTVVLDALKQIK